MNNKPVAWGWYDLEIKQFFPYWDEDLMENKEGCISLYTHPVKELTDEEIQDLMVQSGFIMHDFYSVKIFVESVLRKANEK